MKKRIYTLVSCVIFFILLTSWGYTGHYKISHNSSLSFFTQMGQFNAWVAYLSSHASDADYGSDPGYWHYINIDLYPEFNSSGKIPQTLDSVIAKYGQGFIDNTGIIPWATLAMYDSLKEAFAQSNQTKALFFASELGHYVGDGHNPLHITKNYNGTYSNNDGIHSRYESTMISTYSSQIVYTGDTVRIIPDVRKYIFNYLYNNYKYADSVMLADDYAKGLSADYNSTTYKAALWNKTMNFTVMLFKDASHRLAELIYNAWIEAGSPNISTLNIGENNSNTFSLHCFPDPFTQTIKITYSVPDDCPDINVRIYNDAGQCVAVPDAVQNNIGTACIYWTPGMIPAGIYYIKVQSGGKSAVQKVVYIR